MNERFASEWNDIREAYKQLTPSIMEASARHKKAWIYPYFLDWYKDFTPIEELAWESIRGRGIPLYPQYPVLNYFLDFGNPFLKIGLELDGWEWHVKSEDKERDKRLFAEGWTIYRIRGAEMWGGGQGICESDIEEDENGCLDEHQLRKWLRAGDGVIASIDYVHFSDQPDRYYGLCKETLEAHRYKLDLS